MIRRLVLVAAAALLVIRIPSLVQPMGADQGLYAYVGQRILHGELPYRDAWDQKPPAIHYTYAALWAIWPDDAAVAAADLVLAGIAAVALYGIGRAVAPTGAGSAAALIFLLLSNPAFTRLGGVRLRGQCETFIAVAVAGALLMAVRERSGPRALILSGSLLGVAFAYKYNAVVYAIVVVAALWIVKRLTAPNLLRLMAGFCLPLAVLVTMFALGGALRALVDATVTYNLRYSGETYASRLDVALYLFRFPLERARVDALWTLGGAGCIVLLGAVRGDRARWLAPAWVAASCLSIAINGSRGLPQYFIQAGPALALAAGWAGAFAWEHARISISSRNIRVLAAIACSAIVGIAVWRVNQFPKLVEQTSFDLRRAFGRIADDEYLGRYSDTRKYSPLGMSQLAEYLRSHSQPQERVFVFGFSSAAYVHAERVSASRFFWSRPVIAGFLDGTPGYGIEGLAADLDRARPAVVALQRHDWAPDVDDSAHFFMSTPQLSAWLESAYVHADDGPDEYDVWVRKGAAP